MKRIRDYIEWIKEYIYDPSINIKDRSFMVFSCTVLFALFAAIPCGLIMKEPLTATISTAIGTVFFLAYVVLSFKRNKLAHARIVISFILVFIFLPTMLFTNGGVESGAPIWLLLGTLYISLILERKLKIIMLLCEWGVLAVCWAIAYYYPGLITQYSRGGNFFDIYLIEPGFHADGLIKVLDRQHIILIIERRAPYHPVYPGLQVCQV